MEPTARQKKSIIKYAQKCDWDCTDIDNLQFSHSFENGTYVFKEWDRRIDTPTISQSAGQELWCMHERWCSAKIIMSDYTPDQMAEVMSAYGFTEEQPEEIVAECLFEQSRGLY